MMRTLAVLLFAVQFSSAAVTPPPPKADDLTVKLSKRVSRYDIGALSFVGGLLRVSNDFQIPMGIAWVDSPSAHAEQRFAWKDATVQEIIQTISNAQPGYAVQMGNGVVHVFPGSAIPDGENFLKLRIKAYETHNAMVEVASYKLHMLVTPIRGNHLVSIAGPGDSKVTVDLKNSPVEDILDALAVASNRKIWVVTFSGDAGLTQEGFRRTTSLWTEQPIPDAEQPTWHLMRWGDPVPPLVENKTSQARP